MRWWGIVAGLATLLVVTGCSSSTQQESAESQVLLSSDDALAVAVPADWTRQPDLEKRTIVLAASGPDGQELRVARYPAGQLAEQKAIRQSEVLAGRNVFCERLDGSEVFGDPHLVFDCPVEKGGQVTSRQILVPFEHESGGGLLLVKVAGATLEDAAVVAGPIVESLAWQE